MQRAPDNLVLFDGDCALCVKSLRFIIRRDPRGVFSFAPLRSEAGRRALAESPYGSAAFMPDSVVLVEGGRSSIRTTAGLRIARRLRFPWPLLYAFIIVPRPVRDWFYRILARNRYRWFGRADACELVSPEIRRRLVDGAAPVPASQDGAAAG